MKRICCLALCASLFGGCSMQNSIKELSADKVAASVSIADYALPLFTSDTSYTVRNDTVQKVNFRGREVMLMSAVRDDETGEMVIADEIAPVVVEAKFRNIAERNGFVNIAFDISVPPEMLYSECQLRLYPQLYCLSDTLNLDKVYITGDKYRKNQLRGYELYEKFLSTIIPDSLGYMDAFTRKAMLEKFIERNFEDVAELRNDTSYIDNEQVSVLFGVKFREAVLHYSKKWLIKRNERLIDKKEKMFAKYVKNPLDINGVKLDSVVNQGPNRLKYCYRYPLRIGEKVKKIELKIGGELYDSQELLYNMPDAGPVTYYISSLSSLVQNEVRYEQKVIERDLKINSTAYITFKAGDSRYCDTLASNKAQMRRISDIFYTILSDNSFVADSLVIASLSSPEGGYLYNKRLSQSRANSIKEYLLDYMHRMNDSINGAAWDVDLSAGYGDKTATEPHEEDKISFLDNDFIKLKTDTDPWPELERMILQDSTLKGDKTLIAALSLPDYDARERALSKSSHYPYIKETFYPELRRVDFSLSIHRPGMVKDTVITYQIDSTYMKGVEALDNRDYRKALTILQPYSDINTALAYLCMGYNHSAKAILEVLPKTAKRDYLMALACARLNDTERAAEYFLSSVEADASMRHRGNLDPEISAVIKKYGLENIYNQ